MVSELFGSVFKNIKFFFSTWIVVILVNQIFIFGACFESYCLLAALPHTGVISAFITHIYLKNGDGPKNKSNTIYDLRSEIQINEERDRKKAKITKIKASRTQRDIDQITLKDINILEKKDIFSDTDNTVDNSDEKIFANFKDASEWAKANRGAAITRTNDGMFFKSVEFSTQKNDESISQIPANTSQKDLVDILVDKYEFEFHVPKHPMWRGILTYTNDSESMYILIRKMGINVKFYRKDHQHEFDSRGRLRAAGGRDLGGHTNVRLSYTKGEESIHRRINHMAYLFTNNIQLNADHYFDVGVQEKKRGYRPGQVPLASPPQYYESDQPSIAITQPTLINDNYDMSDIFDN